MPARALTPTPKTYAQLRDAVIAVAIKGRRAIERAWVDTCHETGRLINEHLLLFRDRADYGAQVYAKLAADTQISERSLRQCAQFHRCYPIWHARAKLTWGHYQLLIQVDDTAQRRALEAEAIRKDWKTRDLETRVRAYNAVALTTSEETPLKAVELLKPRCGIPGLCRVVERPLSTPLRAGDGLGIDLGFKNYADVSKTPSTVVGSQTLSKVVGSQTLSKVEGPAASKARFQAGDIVRWDPSTSLRASEAGLQKVADATPAQLFTYRATIRKIIDGDTLDVAITLAPGFTRDLKLRLRGLDCPELSTAAGRAAKAFVEKLLSPGDEVIVCTTKPDKYERYLADVFVRESRAQSLESKDRTSGSPLPALGSQLGAAPIFLNNLLLSARHAIRYDGGAKEE
jgi:endonuclease YncB( thermonuclease family)